MKSCQVAVVGGGIVGLATAYQMMRRWPQISITIIEKESRVAAHQSSHNSGVLHSGIYYKPGSLRALNCRAGKLAMEQFCTEQEIPFELCGKVIVAIDDLERERLRNIYERGLANGVRCEIIGQERLRELEPHAAGIEAIHVPEAGIIDYNQVAQRLAQLIRDAGHTILLNAEVTAIRRDDAGVDIITTAGDIRSRCLITCGGLWSDRLTQMSGDRPKGPIIPFRGEFYELRPAVHHLCRTLIYPVPDPSFPFLGVHFTRTIHGHVECGPNAVLAFARAGYRKADINLRDLFGTLTYPGFRKLVMRNWRTGLGEIYRSWSKSAFVKALQRLIPEIREDHLVTAPSGVRAQAVDRDGKLIDDFVIQRNGRVINVGNAPSPAATASLNIGKTIVEQLEESDLK
ncbi:L-2-hydroxyglutarate oxidase [Planctomicrobium sp. SH664]|uniref:L-2-hydroxyglutarate oxidase n=1 Tax=Planctomicrobium sp. SH664 TaxID=3448125 RepID=UPI003F5C0799